MKMVTERKPDSFIEAMSPEAPSFLASALQRLYDVDIDCDYKRRLIKAVTTPIEVQTAAYTRERNALPTPLDPDNVIFKGLDAQLHIMQGQDYRTSYRDYAILNGLADISFAADFGHSDVDAMRMQREVIAQVNNRCDHNSMAFARLIDALVLRPAGNDMLDIVKKARSGMAEVPEMVRLLKEYPEMISVETSNDRRILGTHGTDEPVRAAYEMAARLRHQFNDAEIILGGNSDESLTPSQEVFGVQVQKTTLAHIKSRDSHSELVIKIPYMHTANGIVRMGVTTYLRVADYEDRPGYSHEPLSDAHEPWTPEYDLRTLENAPAELARHIIQQMLDAGITNF